MTPNSTREEKQEQKVHGGDKNQAEISWRMFEQGFVYYFIGQCWLPWPNA